LLRGSQLDRSTLRQEFEQLHQARPGSGLARVGPTTPKRATASASKRLTGGVPKLAHVSQQGWVRSVWQGISLDSIRTRNEIHFYMALQWNETKADRCHFVAATESDRPEQIDSHAVLADSTTNSEGNSPAMWRMRQ
jgi:hypothetical protein